MTDNDAIFRAVMQEPKVRAAVRAKATSVVQRARREALRRKTPAEYKLVEHVLPNGRYGFNVEADLSACESRNQVRQASRALRIAQGK